MTHLEKLAREIKNKADKATDGQWNYYNRTYDEINGTPLVYFESFGARRGPHSSEFMLVSPHHENKIGLTVDDAEYIKSCYPARISALMDAVLAYEAKMQSISKNGCCETCQEAKLFALSALAYAEERLAALEEK